MWMMLQQGSPEDVVIAPGQQYSVREFVNAAAEELGMKLTWRGHGLDEKAFDASGRGIVAVDPRYFRPAEVDTLIGDASKARARLGWRPRTTFRETVREMVASDLQAAECDPVVRQNAYKVATYHDSPMN